jgi:multidrug resistance protein MdtO
MASQSGALPAVQPSSSVDHAGEWFWNFLKSELAPYPGRTWIVARMTIAATIVMLLVMTFRLPGGALAGIFTLFLSRENPTATLRAGLRIVLAFVAATVYVIVAISMSIDDPLTHFLWVVVSLFISFYLIRVMADYGTAVGFGFMIAGAIPLWDQTTLSVNDRVENTLWLTFAVTVGVAVTVVVEYVFRRVHPADDMIQAIEARLKSVEGMLQAVAEDKPPSRELREMLMQYASVGTSRLRRLLLRSDGSAQYKAEMNTGIALLGRLVDLAGSFQLALSQRTTPVEASDRERCKRLAGDLAILCEDLSAKKTPRDMEAPPRGPSSLRFLEAMETTISLIPKAFAGSKSLDKFIPAPLDEEVRARFLVADAFSNPAHLQFALRGTLAATACYVTYTAIDWPGLSTAMATCLITALSTIGSSRQKQMLRLSGAFLGGIVIGMGAQVFILPYLDSIVGFTVLFAVVTAIAAWISVASSRLSYLGIQLALAFYLINLQEFTIQTSLTIARDRVFGVLLGLVSMWLLFDRLGVRNALDEMQTVFARNLEKFAQLAEQLLEDDQVKSIRGIRLLRDQINAGFQAVYAQADAIIFEFGPQRQRKLEIRADIRRWQPSIRTLLHLQITYWQYRVQQPVRGLPDVIAQTHIAFERDVAVVMRAMANEVSGKPALPIPDIRAAADRLRQVIVDYFTQQGTGISAAGSDVIALTEGLASVLVPLSDDIQAAFAPAPLQPIAS